MNFCQKRKSFSPSNLVAVNARTWIMTRGRTTMKIKVVCTYQSHTTNLISYLSSTGRHVRGGVGASRREDVRKFSSLAQSLAFFTFNLPLGQKNCLCGSAVDLPPFWYKSRRERKSQSEVFPKETFLSSFVNSYQVFPFKVSLDKKWNKAEKSWFE